MNCLDSIQTTFFIFSDQVPQLLYYSHLPAFIISLILGIWIFTSANKSLESRIFLILSLVFSALSFSNLILWTNSNTLIVSIFWILTIELFNWLMFLTAYFFYVFINKKDIKFYLKIIGLILLFVSPLLILTQFGIDSFDISSCELIINGKYYLYQLFINVLAILGIISTFIIYKKTTTNKSKENNLLFMAVIIFSVFFVSTWHLSSFLDIFVYEQLGYLGFVVFIILLAYIIVRFKAFHIKLIASQALVWGLVALIGSQFFFIKVTTNFILNGITFVGIIILGQFLIKSVKREVMQREQLQILSEQLFDANEKLKGLDKLKTEFVSLASHQLRSPLTAIKGYTSMLLEGDYGEISPQAKEKIERVMESSNNLTLVVEDLLNVSKIESGGMKYVMEKFDFGELAINTVKELSITAEGKGLKLICSIPNDKKYFVNGDKEKLRQILINLIDNSMKYTKEGQIEVNIYSDNGKIILTVKDTGVGIEKGKEEALFDKFTRGEGAKLNTSGSGLGLYLVREIAKAHNGRVWAESEGVGKGSTFFVEIAEVK